ncbi:hypothetical protein EKH77_13955 [Streptomyces luteoverticillatus]|uniref:DUF3592 domain-containing protein n=1 Tax=Streptomyces luteoverticillatus TaxID=66425 RepID=A0A3Q9FZK2_STRLT|nr:DUF3592 domain-containing protein [Streptomyces luteoverticillatus]AZQ72174.1 hypothetical protein EKH77_13955 [Streptomyces luteoverticillatus]
MLLWLADHYREVMWVVFASTTILVAVFFVVPFGVRPLMTDRRLRSSGVAVKGECVAASWSEDRVSETFQFKTLEGRTVFYRSPLRGSRIADTGEVLEILYDPRSPRRARTVRELKVGSSARLNLWGGIAVLVLMQLVFWGVDALIGSFHGS